MAEEQATGVAGAVPGAVEARTGTTATRDEPEVESTTDDAEHGSSEGGTAGPDASPEAAAMVEAPEPEESVVVPAEAPEPTVTEPTVTEPVATTGPTTPIEQVEPVAAVEDSEPMTTLAPGEPTEPTDATPAGPAADPAPVEPVDATPADAAATSEPVEPEGAATPPSVDHVPDPESEPLPDPGPEGRPAPQPRPTPASLTPPRPAAAPDPAPPADTPTPGSAASEVSELPTVVPASEEPGRWGRVDADGTVWTVAPEGDRAVGSWQAGDAVEGLAHYARRFDDLRTEADLLVRRLQSGRGDAAGLLRSAAVLRERLDVAAVVGDLPGLVVRLDAVITAAEQAGRVEKSAKSTAREQAVARKEALIGEAETLAEETTRWKHAGDRFSAMLEEWKTIRGIDRKTDDALWKRFAKARETFTRRRGAHFAEMDRARATAKSRKEELVTEAESLQESEDWGPTAGRYKELMVEWKAAGRTSKDADDALWARFRGAQDHFFARRSATFDARDAEFVGNARAKETLLAEAAAIDLSDIDSARAALRCVQERWDDVGKVPRERVREFATRLKEVEDRVRAAVDKRWSRVDPEKEARVGQFRERVAQYEAQAAKARSAGDERRAKEADRQAEQWREWLAAAERATG